jgi:hypothetical protein
MNLQAPVREREYLGGTVEEMRTTFVGFDILALEFRLCNSLL